MLVEEDVKGFLDELGSDSPAPGGGSVAALCGALGAALSEMVCNLTVGKEKYADVKEEVEGILVKVKEEKAALTGLIDEDTEAFNKVMEAFKLPKGSEERKQALQEGFKTAASVPLKTCRACVRVLEMAVVVCEKGNKNSITDAGVAALVAHAGFHGAAYNVKINLGSIKDEAFVTNTKKELEKLEGKADALVEKTKKLVGEELA